MSSISYIYHSDTDVSRRSLDASVPAEYAIKDNRLYVYSAQGNCQIHVRPQTLYAVSFDKTPPSIAGSQAPVKKADVLMWLLGFNNRSRAHSIEHYKTVLERLRSLESESSHDEQHISGEDYELVVFTYDDSSEIRNVIGYIKKGTPITRSLVKDLLCQWPYPIRYPRSYTQKILHKRFKFTPTECEEIFAANPRLFP